MQNPPETRDRRKPWQAVGRKNQGMSLRCGLLVFRAVPVLLLFGVLAGCSPWIRGGGPGEIGMLPEGRELLRSIEAQRAPSVAGSARVRLKNLKKIDKTVEFDADIACSRSGLCRLEGLDLWGHLLFLAILREGTLTVYWAGDRAYSEDPSDAEHLEKILGLSLSGPELIELLLGNPLFKSLNNEPQARVFRDSKGLLVLEAWDAEGLRYRVWLDASRRPVRSRLEGAGALAGVDVAFDRYRQVGHFLFPGRIRVLDGEARELLSLTYGSVSLGESLSPELFEFTPPEGCERVWW